MTDADFPPYDEIPRHIGELIERLTNHDDAEVVNSVRRLQLLNEEFNRAGVNRLMHSVFQWRGEIFFDNLKRDDVIRAFLARYGVPG